MLSYRIRREEIGEQTEEGDKGGVRNDKVCKHERQFQRQMNDQQDSEHGWGKLNDSTVFLRRLHCSHCFMTIGVWFGDTNVRLWPAVQAPWNGE